MAGKPKREKEELSTSGPAAKKKPRAGSRGRKPIELKGIIVIPGPMTDGQKAAWARFWRSIMHPAPDEGQPEESPPAPDIAADRPGD